MGSFKIGKEYIIYVRGQKTPEWNVKILSFYDSSCSKLYVKFLTGDKNIIGKEKFITSKFYDFEEYQDTQSLEENLEKYNDFTKELSSIREINNKIREKIGYYKDIEREAMCARCAFVAIIWLYIFGYIRLS